MPAPSYYIFVKGKRRVSFIQDIIVKREQLFVLRVDDNVDIFYIYGSGLEKDIKVRVGVEG